MRTRLLPALALIIAAPAFSAKRPDLAVTLSAPTAIYVYDMGRYNVTVANIGTKDASSVTLTIQLPQTHWNPPVVMGELGAKSTSCSLTGTKYNCSLGTIRRNRSTSVYFDIKLPQSAAPLQFAATGQTAGETNLANNTANHTATLLYYNLPLDADPPRSATNSHCLGNQITAYFECTLFPWSITVHNTIFSEGGGLDFDPPYPGYSGGWSQLDPTHLSFQYYIDNILRSDFTGYAVDGSACYEGLATLHDGSNQFRAYRVCLQP